MSNSFSISQVTQDTLLAGERNPESASNRYFASNPECNYYRVTTIGSDVEVYSGPFTLYKIINEGGANPQIVLIKDDSTTILTLSASDIPIGGLDLNGMKLNTNLTVNIAATGDNLLILGRPT